MAKTGTRTISIESDAGAMLTADSTAKRGGPMSVARVLGVLDSLTDGPVALADLARLLEVPKPSLLAILGEMVVLGYVRRDQDGRYLLGSRAFRLAFRMSIGGSLSSSVRATLIELSRELEAAVSLSYLDPESHTLIYADRYGESSAVRYVVKFGAAIQLHTRATGKLLAAYEDETSWPDWFGPEPYKQLTPYSHVGMATLRKELLEIRKTGVAWTFSEQYEGISGCALPVYGYDDKVVAGIGLVMIGESLEKYRDKVLSALSAAVETMTAEFRLRRITKETLASYI
jgi:DNA-binding IclR family transcriptional regulator